jgi:glycine cleavage system H lipoate-binding protein
MADGRQYLSINGYSNLASSKVEANLTTLGYTTINTPKSNTPETTNTWMIVLVVFVIAGMIVPIMMRTTKVKKSHNAHNEIQFAHGLNENSVVAPKGLYFDKTHTWAFMEKNGTVKVGIDDFLQHITGTITRIKMKETGEKVRKGEKIMTIIHEGKRLNLYAPISGVILEQNQSLVADSWLVNSSPYAEGWVYLIEPKNWTREIQFMFMGEKYKEWIKNEFSRLKDFVADSMKVNTLAYSHVILQDGGELSDNVLADLGPEVWEDFQTRFIDTSK